MYLPRMVLSSVDSRGQYAGRGVIGYAQAASIVGNGLAGASGKGLIDRW